MESNLFVFYCLLAILGYIQFKGAESKTSSETYSHVESSFKEVTAPVKQITHDLNQALNEIEKKKQDIKKYHNDVLKRLANSPKRCHTKEMQMHALNLKDWDFHSCVELTDDLKEASDLAYDGGLLVENLTRSALNLTKGLIECPTNTDTSITIECYNSNIKMLRERMVIFRNKSVPIVTKGTNVLTVMRLDFDKCIGIPVTSEVAIEEKLKDC